MAVRCSVLKVWKRSQPDSKTAYTKLCEALRNKDVNMESFIEGVFGPNSIKMHRSKDIDFSRLVGNEIL